MQKKVLSYLFVAVVAYCLGTVSTLHAKDEKNDSESIKAISEKLDQVLSNQKEMQSTLKKIWNRM